MNLNVLRYVIEVEKNRSITGAARQLFISQPNLSRDIRELEEEIGFSIFTRSSRGVIPTEKGREFLALAIVGGPRNGELQESISPCGVCRQVLSEFCPPDMPVIAAESDRAYRIYTLGQLLPHHFGPDHLREGGGK